ncbi:hypoxanthine phosphoribosyltransferase [Candidatus Entotheonella serta]|nr:hypoxanthine phosphoribosyltransferase [Candidatus Entotheonella serta]
MTPQLQSLLSAEAIQKRVSALGAQLNGDYAQSEAVRVIGVLKGAWIFLADLVRQLDLPVSCDFLGVSSYGQATSSSGVTRLTTDLNEPIAGLDVILVEDIVDTGLTMRFLSRTLALREPRSIRTCTLLDKPSRRRAPFTPDYVGFTIPDQFVVGSGLDWAGAYRHLPYIAIWQPQEG